MQTHVYLSISGEKRIAVYTFDVSDDAITFQETEPTPRVFNIDKTGHYLFVDGQGSGKLATYRINREGGILEPLKGYDVGSLPVNRSTV